MTDIRSLEQTLGNNLSWNQSRINFLAKFILALIKVRSVNLTEVANGFGGKASADSSYRRLKRFFQLFEISYSAVALLVLKLMALQAPFVLTLDRTNWKLGKSNLNILVLGVAYKGIAIPLLWTLLDKRGNSNTTERIALLSQYLALLGCESIKYLTADREFIGKTWFGWLLLMKIDFRLRVKENTQVSNARGELVAAKNLFRHLPLNQVLALQQARQMWGLEIYLSGMRLESGEYLLIVAPHFAGEAMQEYGARWEIETLFGCLKSRGFNLEETHMIEPEKLKKLIALLAIAFCWAHKVGEWLQEQKAIKVKKHGRLAKSIFRRGLDHLQEVILNLAEKSKQIAFVQLIAILSRT